jgi:drug/metabolite transporter (DMT)-like permease
LHRRDVGPTILCGFFTITAFLYFTALGLTLLPAGRAAVLAYTMPLWAAVAGVWLLQERLTRRRIVSLALGLLAVLILAGDDLSRLGTTPYGVLAILAAAASWGLGTVMQKKTAWQTPLFTVVAWQLLFGGVPLAALALLFDSDPYATFTMQGALGMAYVVLIATAAGYWLWFRIIQMVPAGVASLSVLPVPLIGLSLSALFLGETVGWPEAAALACMTLALAIMSPLRRLRLR